MDELKRIENLEKRVAELEAERNLLIICMKEVIKLMTNGNNYFNE